MSGIELWAKVLLAVVAVAGWTALARWRRAGAGRGHADVVWLWCLTRLGLLLAVWLVSGLDAPSDIQRFYLPQARAALDGALVYRDIVSSYGPLFPYLAALPIAVWNRGAALVVFAILWELAAMAAWGALARRHRGGDEAVRALRLYLCNPLAIVNVVLVGQNQVWMAALWGGAAWLLARRRAFAAGVVAMLSVVGVKLLGLLALPALWWRAGSRRRFAAGAALAAIVAVVPFAAAGADVLQPLRLEGDQLTSGNLPYLLTLVGLDPGVPALTWPLTALAAAALLVTAALVERTAAGDPAADRVIPLETALSCLMLVFLLVSRKSYASYLAIVLLPLSTAVVAARLRLWQQAAFLALCGLATIEPSLWFRWMEEATLARLDGWHAAAFLLVEGVLVAGYVGLLVAIWPSRRLTPSSAP